MATFDAGKFLGHVILIGILASSAYFAFDQMNTPFQNFVGLGNIPPNAVSAMGIIKGAIIAFAIIGLIMAAVGAVIVTNDQVNLGYPSPLITISIGGTVICWFSIIMAAFLVFLMSITIGPMLYAMLTICVVPQGSPFYIAGQIGQLVNLLWYVPVFGIVLGYVFMVAGSMRTGSTGVGI